MELPLIKKGLEQTMPIAWQHNKDLGDCLIELYKNRLWTDVKLRCKDHDGNERIHAHKVVLAARSPVFQAMFFGPCANGKDDVELDNVEKRILDLFLRYIYNDTVALTEENASSVLEMAHYYQVTNLVQFCADYLTTILSPENICEMLTLAMRYDVTTLRDTCCAFIDKHADRIMKTKGFLKLEEDCLTYVLKGDTFYADEDTIFFKAEEWTSRKLKESSMEKTGPNIRKVLGASFYYLRLPTMTYQTLMECTRKKGFFSVEEYEDIVDFINKIPASSVESNSCVARLPTKETLDINNEVGETNISDNITTSFQIFVSRDVKLKHLILAKIHKYLKYDDTFYSTQNCRSTSVYEHETSKFISKYKDKVVKLQLGRYNSTACVLKELCGEDLSRKLNIVISGNIQVKCHKVKLPDGAVDDDKCGRLQADNEKEAETDGNRSEEDSGTNDSDSDLDELHTDDEDNDTDDSSDEEEEVADDAADGECLIFDQDILLQSTEFKQRVIELKEPLTLTQVESPYKVTVNLKYSCKSGIKMKTCAGSEDTVTSEYGHVKVENITGEFAGIKSLGFENISNRETVKETHF